MVTNHVVHKCCAWIPCEESSKVNKTRGQRSTRPHPPVSSYGHALIDAVGVARDDVVELVRHATGARHIGNASRSIQTRGHNVVHHATGVANLETPWLDATNLEYRGMQFITQRGVTSMSKSSNDGRVA